MTIVRRVIGKLRRSASDFIRPTDGRPIQRGYEALERWPTQKANGATQPEPNPLQQFFDARKHGGRGIWKWQHYFDVYDEHFRSFRGREVHVLEIGIYSGGSLDLWRDYFGPKAHIYGVDLEQSCKVYEADGAKIFIGDQADRTFWHDVKKQVPTLDIVIDDGGHLPEQQIVTLEELLPHLRPGGVFLCEDVHGSFNQFASYAHGLCHKLNETNGLTNEVGDQDSRIVCPTTPFQSSVASIHFHPFITVVKRNAHPLPELRAPKHGTQWQPYLR